MSRVWFFPSEVYKFVVRPASCEKFQISIYPISDLGDLSNLIGSLSLTIQQYSTHSEWIMCELGVFPNFLENDLSKVDEILRLTFFKVIPWFCTAHNKMASVEKSMGSNII